MNCDSSDAFHHFMGTSYYLNCDKSFNEHYFLLIGGWGEISDLLQMNLGLRLYGIYRF
jgi:hypothetical protein